MSSNGKKRQTKYVYKEQAKKIKVILKYFDTEENSQDLKKKTIFDENSNISKKSDFDQKKNI